MASTRIAFYWPDGRVPELASTPARHAAAKGTEGRRNPRLARAGVGLCRGHVRLLLLHGAQPYSLFADPRHLGVKLDNPADPKLAAFSEACGAPQGVGFIQGQRSILAFEMQDVFPPFGAVLLTKGLGIDCGYLHPPDLTIEASGAEVSTAVNGVEVVIVRHLHCLSFQCVADGCVCGRFELVIASWNS